MRDGKLDRLSIELLGERGPWQHWPWTSRAARKGLTAHSLRRSAKFICADTKCRKKDGDMREVEHQGMMGRIAVNRMTMDDLVAFNNMAWRWVHGKKQPYLTDRELAYAIAVVVDGKSPKAVAEAMGVSSQTVSFVIRKLSFAQKRDWTSEDH